MNTTLALFRQDPADPAAEMFGVDGLDHPTGHALPPRGSNSLGCRQERTRTGRKRWAGKLPDRGHQARGRRGWASPGRSSSRSQGDSRRTSSAAAPSETETTLRSSSLELFRHPASDRGAVVGMKDGFAHGVTCILALPRRRARTPDSIPPSVSPDSLHGSSIEANSARPRSLGDLRTAFEES